MTKLCCYLCVAAALVLFAESAAQAADIQIVNNDAPGEGFNDDTPRDPVAGNDGATLGQQRLKALQYAADLLGERLVSTVTIRVDAQFDAPSSGGLECSRRGSTLAATGAAFLVSFDDGRAPTGARANIYYPVALANALAGRDLSRTNGSGNGADIVATFNSGVDSDPQCLRGVRWYYGLDNNPPGNDINFISTAVHELVHGLGFATFATVEHTGGLLSADQCGAFFMGLPDIYSTLIRNLPGGRLNVNKTWPEMSRRQRCTSITNDGYLVWDGSSVTSQGVPLYGPATGTNQGRLQLYAPTTIMPGSSVSHWDTELTPNALMEPFDEGDVAVPEDIGVATCLLQDIGWRLAGGARCPDNGQRTGQVASNSPLDKAFGSGSGPGSGGGCTLAAGGPAEPVLALLVALGLLGLRRRRA